MRPALRSNIHPITFETAAEPVGLCLGYDYCGEHEWGISRIKEEFGIGKHHTIGIESRQVTNIPSETVAVCSDGADLCLIAEFNFANYEKSIPAKATISNRGILHAEKWLPSIVQRNTSVPEMSEFTEPDGRKRWRKPRNKAEWAEHNAATNGFYTAWDSGGFLVRARGEEAHSLLKRIVTALENLDLVISLGGSSNPFARSGLNLIIASEIPDEVRANVKAADEDHAALLAAVKATGIEERLQKAGRRYFALVPRWTDDSKSDIEWWLNPMEQKANNFGWFKLADLNAWAEGKGPIPQHAE